MRKVNIQKSHPVTMCTAVVLPKHFNTGEWRTATPVIDESKCVHCLLCAPVCPDSCIPVVGGKRLDFDLNHCKGCGICAYQCKFGAITMKEGK